MRLDRINCDSILEIDATGRPLADKAREVIYWYFAEVTKMKADIGVSEVEKQAAGTSGRIDALFNNGVI